MKRKLEDGITHPTSSSEEVNLAQPGLGRDIPLCRADNQFRFRSPLPSYIQGIHAVYVYMYRDL